MIGLVDTAVVYTPTATGYTDVANAALPCRLALVATDTAATGQDRTELASTRRLLWGPDYLMPENAQIEVDGERWNVRPGTLAAVRGPSGNVVYRRCEVTRAV